MLALLWSSIGKGSMRATIVAWLEEYEAGEDDAVGGREK